MKLKRILFITFLTTLILCHSFSSFAKDLALKVVDGQDNICILGTVSDINDKHIITEFYDFVGKTTDKKINEKSMLKIERFKYSYCTEHGWNYNTPKIGDNVFLSVKDKGDGTYLCEVAYKTDTVDIRTLNLLVPSNMENKDCMQDMTVISYFIKSDGEQLLYAFTDGVVYMLTDNKEVQIYPLTSKTPVSLKFITGEGKQDASTDKKEDVLAVNTTFTENIIWYNNMLFGKRVISIGVIFSGMILGMIVVYLVSVRKSKSDKEK